MPIPIIPNMTSPLHQGNCTLLPINLASIHETTELLRQRKICGWHYDHSCIDQWHLETQNKTRSMFWITTASHEDAVMIKAGHIALASDPDLAATDKSSMTISTFFILPEHRSRGLGNDAMDAVEALATREPYGSVDCRAIVVDTLDRRYWELDGEECRWWWGRWGKVAPERGRSGEDWYRRRGDVKVKGGLKYEDGLEGGGLLMASYLRKQLR